MSIDAETLGIILGSVATIITAIVGGPTAVRKLREKSKGSIPPRVVSDLEQRTAKLETAMDVVCGQCERLDVRIGEVHGRVDDVHNRITEQTRVIANIGGRLEGYFSKK